MRQQATKVVALLAVLALAAGIPFYAQEHAHEQQQQPSRQSGGAASTMVNSQSIF